MLGDRAISSAPKARAVGWRISFGGLGLGLSCRGGALELMTEVVKVFLADVQLQYFFDHRREVCQRADRSQRRGAGGPYESPCRGKHEGVLNRFQWHAALVQLGRQHPVRTADGATRTRSQSVGVQKPAHIVAMFHQFSPAARATKDR